MLLFFSMLDGEEEKSRFAIVYEKYRYFLWYLANERLHDAYLAEDAVQETFLALTRHMDKIRDPESVATRNFLATIVKNKAIDLLRSKKGIVEENYEESADKRQQEDLLDACLSRESYERILAAVGELDEIYRVVFEYKYLYELRDSEIADLLGVTPKVVNVRIFRARKKLQLLLAEMDQVSCGQNK
ncbi:MAG: sigma-70 family RNA polymerase sigma factor [Clostridiales bacterium]|nr:sigma-70 family RNA polymerase sigma factor [Clostridiales bacterium]